MATTQELIFRITRAGDPALIKSDLAQIRSELSQTAKTQKTTSQAELSTRQQLAAAQSLQRQRSAALIAQWKQQERAAAQLAAGVKPVATNLQTITDVMRTMGSSIGVLQGPLNGISGRFTALGTLARGAGGDLAGAGASATSAGGSIAAIAGPIGIAAIAIAALAAGSVVLAKGFFDLAVAAADFRGKMFDLAQQTGVAVEVLSTLEILAATTGGSIDSIAQSLVIFQGHLDDAQDSSSKAAIKFKELGISTNNTEDAFIDALRVLAKMPEGFKQTNDAAELFGRRGGKQVLAILKEMDGDLPGTIAKLREMGLVISEEDARAADEFNDQLAILQFQFRALLGASVIPAALVALKTLSELVTANRAVFIGLGDVLGTFSRGVLAVFLNELYKVNNALVLIQLAAYALDRLRGVEFPGVTGGAGGEDSFARATGGAGAPARTGGGGKSKTQRDEIYKAALDASQEASAKEIEEQRNLSVALNQAYELNLVNLSDYYSKRQGLIDLNFNEEIDAINREQEALDAARARGLIKKEEAAKKEEELTLRTTKAQNKLEEETNQLRIDKQRALDRVALETGQQLASIRVAQREGELKRIQQLLDVQAITESDALGRQIAIAKEIQAERLLLIEEELKQITTSATRKIELDNAKLESEQRFTDELKRLTDERIDAMNRESAANAPGVAGNVDLQDPLAGLGQRIEAEVGPPPALQQHIDVIGTLRGAYEDLAGSIAQGVGQMISNLVLFGKVGPESFRKVLAASLAAVAAQAGVQAIYELALGIAALTPWGAAIYGPAAFHFKSAALLASIALASGVAGRAVAGGTFSEPTSGGGASGGSSRATSPTKPEPIEVNRRQGSSALPPITIVVSGEAGEAFNYKVVKAVVGDHRLNGPIRMMTERGES